jgi:hypothetical protein
LCTAFCTGTTDPTTVTESFSGTVQLRSSVWHNFTVSAAGTARVTLVSLASSAPNVGLAIGQSQNGCQKLTWIDQATSGATLSWDSDPGVHCVLIYDSGTLSEAATYTVSVTHP